MVYARGKMPRKRLFSETLMAKYPPCNDVGLLDYSWWVMASSPWL